MKGELGKDFRLTQPFGVNPDIYRRFGMKGHNGLDYAGPNPGDKIPCYAAFSGTVTRVGYDAGGFGKYVRVVSDDRSTEATYAHLDSIDVKAGDHVGTHRQLGIIGTTGYSSGVHLHFQIRLLYQGEVQNYDNGFKGAIDPAPLIQYWGEVEPPVSDEEREAVKWAKSHGITNGERMDEFATRLETVLMLYRTYHIPK